MINFHWFQPMNPFKERNETNAQYQIHTRVALNDAKLMLIKWYIRREWHASDDKLYGIVKQSRCR